MKLYEKQFSESFDYADAPATTKTIIIASTPRSGSHMLGHTMIETRALGVPFEYANPVNLRRWREMSGEEDLGDVMRWLMRRRTTPNGVFAIKLHLEHLSQFGGLRQVLDFFPDPQVVRIVRANLLEQAISLTIAAQTGVWISGQEGNGRKPVYDYARVRRNLERLAIAVAQWDMQLSDCGVPSMMIECSQFASRARSMIGQLADHCGIEQFDDVAEPSTRRQSPSVSAEWMRRVIVEAEGAEVRRRSQGKAAKPKLRAGTGPDQQGVGTG